MKSTSNSIPRREFLVQSSVATAAVGLAVAPQLASASASIDGKSMLDLQSVQLESLVGEKFAISRQAESKDDKPQMAEMVLNEVKDHSHSSDRLRPSNVRRHGYSLLLQVANGGELSDGVYRVRHPRLRTTELFLNSTVRAENPNKQHLVAVIN